MRGRMMQACATRDVDEPHARGGAVRKQPQDAERAVNALRSIGLLVSRHVLLRCEGAPLFRSRDGGRPRPVGLGGRRPSHGRGRRPNMQNTSVAGAFALLRHAWRVAC